MSMDPPNPRCYECDAELTDLDGDWNACGYTGGACPPGGCDCGRATEALCDECTCPGTGGHHVWVTEWASDMPGMTKRQRTHCDECPASVPIDTPEPERDYP
jgi:hypothetical protein